MKRLIWQAAYAVLCFRSGYDFTPREAWQEASDAWDNQQQRGDGDPIATPKEAFRLDKREWMTR